MAASTTSDYSSPSLCLANKARLSGTASPCLFFMPPKQADLPLKKLFFFTFLFVAEFLRPPTSFIGC